MRHMRVVLALAVSLLGVAVPIAVHAAQAVTIDSNLVVKVRPAPKYKIAARASVILLAGGNGVLNLNGQGDTRDLQGNFLVRRDGSSPGSRPAPCQHCNTDPGDVAPERYLLRQSCNRCDERLRTA